MTEEQVVAAALFERLPYDAITAIGPDINKLLDIARAAIIALDKHRAEKWREPIVVCEPMWDKATMSEPYQHPRPKIKGLRP